MARTANDDPLDKFRFKIFETSPTTNASGVIVKAKDAEGNELPTDTAPVSTALAGFHDFQLPKSNTNKITYREGDNPNISSISPGLTSFEDVTLSKGISSSKYTWFYDWANSVHSGRDTTSTFNYTIVNSSFEPNAEVRKHLDVVMMDRTGKAVRRWRLFNCFPVNFVPGSDLNATEDGEKSMESLTICYESFREINTDGSEALKI